MQNEEEKVAGIATSGRVYEVGYLLLPSISDEELPNVCGDLKDVVYNLGGNFIADDAPKMIDLAYSMTKVIANEHKKFDKAYFGWLKFEMEPEKLSELKQSLETNTNILRFLLIKTVRENTIATKRFASKDMIHRKSTAKRASEEPVEINKEEIDKEIEAMVATDIE